MPIYWNWTNVPAILKAKGWTVYRLATELDMEPSAVYKLLKRKRAKIVEEPTLDALCRVLDCQPGDLLTRRAR